MNKKVCLLSYGCKTNQYELQLITENIERSGYKIVNDYKKAEHLIINSCAVTENSISKLKKKIRRCIKDNPGLKISILGCAAEYGFISKYSNVVNILGNKEKYAIGKKLSGISSTNKIPPDDIKEYSNHLFSEENITYFSRHTRATVKVQDGCDNYCAYCIVPFLRGEPVSKPLASIIDEIKQLVNNGYREIVLTGIELGNYRYKDINLETLLKKIADIEGEFRIRLSSINPDRVTDELIEIIKKEKKICKHIHLPLQSGSSRILKRMNRKYDVNYYKKLCGKIYKEIPDTGISTDIIVGFPGETESDYENTLKLMKEIKFCRSHIFRYSNRKRTAASEMICQVAEKVKTSRMKRAVKTGLEIQQDFIKERIGMKYKVLIEYIDNRYAYGYTTNYMRMKIKTGKKIYRVNMFYDITIDENFI